MPYPLTPTQQLDNFYRYLMNAKGYKQHEIDQSDIHHLFRLIRQEVKESKQEEKPEPKEELYYIDQVPGW
ncbi:hypothetical protein POL82_03230 [Priestia aryabhattai]|uniref:hypothetical protein n=1 Tax=Priestia aryabhattai TaxID=412384 RepID=UPI00234E9507|nr:hypothetical protein [Priestia aryabhattai]MDC7762479.1 hypothetical protein [Priestia aryabhattai]